MRTDLSFLAEMRLERDKVHRIELALSDAFEASLTDAVAEPETSDDGPFDIPQRWVRRMEARMYLSKIPIFARGIAQSFTWGLSVREISEKLNGWISEEEVQRILDRIYLDLGEIL